MENCVITCRNNVPIKNGAYKIKEKIHFAPFGYPCGNKGEVGDPKILLFFFKIFQAVWEAWVFLISAEKGTCWLGELEHRQLKKGIKCRLLNILP